MNNQTKLFSELNQTRAAVLYELSIEAGAQARCGKLVLDELCDWRNRLYARLDAIDCCLSWIPVEKRARPARRTFGSLIQQLLATVPFLDRSRINPVFGRRFCHDKH